MSEKVIVAVDAMGGDNAPEEIVKGAVESLQKSGKIFIKLVGKEDAVNAELAKYEYAKDRIEVVNATEVIETGEPPVKAVMKKKDSSLVRAMKMVKAWYDATSPAMYIHRSRRTVFSRSSTCASLWRMSGSRTASMVLPSLRAKCSLRISASARQLRISMPPR